MSDEIKDGFNRAKELALSIVGNANDMKIELAKAQAKALYNHLDCLEATIDFFIDEEL